MHQLWSHFLVLSLLCTHTALTEIGQIIQEQSTGKYHYAFAKGLSWPAEHGKTLFVCDFWSMVRNSGVMSDSVLNSAEKSTNDRNVCLTQKLLLSALLYYPIKIAQKYKYTHTRLFC